MSLYTVGQKLSRVYDLPFWKYVILFGFLPALWGLVVVQYVIPSAPTNLTSNETKLVVLAFFSLISLALSTFAISISLYFIWFLIKVNDKILRNSGRFFGNSLSTNNGFLTDLAKGLFPKIIGFIRGYNEPKLEELETKYERHHNERMENERLYLNHNNRLEEDLRKTNFVLRAQNKNKDTVIEKLQSDLQIVLDSITELKEEIKKLKGDKDPVL